MREAPVCACTCACMYEALEWVCEALERVCEAIEWAEAMERVCEARSGCEAMYTIGYNSIPVKLCQDAEFFGSSGSKLTLHCMARKSLLTCFHSSTR